MEAEINNIIEVINSHEEWPANVKIRYAYITLGQLVEKDVFFFYTIQNNLNSGDKAKLKYSIDEIEKKMIVHNNFDYKVICKNAAEMLKYIYDNCNIESEVIKTTDADYYKENSKTVEIRHYFLSVTGDENKKYALTLVPDLPNIHLGRMTSHFGNSKMKFIDSDNAEKKMYEGDEIDFSILSYEEIKKYDEIIGFDFTYLHNKNGEESIYSDYFFDLLKKMYKTKDEFLKELVQETEFYVDVCSFFRNRSLSSSNSYLEINPFDISHNRWEKFKAKITLQIMIKYYNEYNLMINNDINSVLDKYYDLLMTKDYDNIFTSFLTDLKNDNQNIKKLNNLGVLNPLLKVKQLTKLLKTIDGIEINPNDHKLYKEFVDTIYDLSIIFVPTNYLVVHKGKVSNQYIMNKIVICFKKIFDLGSHTEYNDLPLFDKIIIIKEMLEIILQEIPVDKSNPNYNYSKSPVENRIFSTVLFDKDENKPFYMICINDQNQNGVTPLLYDFTNNILYTNKSFVDITSNYNVIKNEALELLIEKNVEGKDV